MWFVNPNLIVQFQRLAEKAAGPLETESRIFFIYYESVVKRLCGLRACTQGRTGI